MYNVHINTCTLYIYAVFYMIQRQLREWGDERREVLEKANQLLYLLAAGGRLDGLYVVQVSGAQGDAFS